MLNALLPLLAAERETVIALQTLLVAHPALSPDGGGIGEAEKAAALQQVLAGYGFPAPRLMPAKDTRVPGGLRPNWAYLFDGENTARTLWILGHVDVVAAGERAAWQTDPFCLAVEGDKLIGRGVEDNHQALVSMALLGKALATQKAKPPINLGLLYLADEETGNAYGMHHVLAQHGALFKKDDLFLVPDCGDPKGLQIEVAEKGSLWVKVTITGRQCHASTPHLGRNSLRAAAAFILRLDEMEHRFPAQNALFDPPRSTFEPTKKEANVENVNILPGRDVFYIDCRVLPEYSLDDVFKILQTIGADIAAECGVEIAYDIVQRSDAAPITAPDAEIVQRLQKALRDAGRGEARILGIGGGTFAAPLRRQGHQAAAWATILENAHQPNETALISACLADAQIMARVLWG